MDKFEAVCAKVNSKEMAVDQALVEIKDIDFMRFSIDQMEKVQNADWLPDEKYVEIMKGWIRLHDQVLLQLRAYLVVTPEITKEMLVNFVKAVQQPSEVPNITVDKIISLLATAGGTRPFVNPITQGLIKVSGTKPNVQSSYASVYDEDKDKHFSSLPEDKAHIIFELPPFLKAQVTKYYVGCSQKLNGICNWSFEGTNDERLTDWKSIDTRKSDTKLARDCKLAEYEITNPESFEFYRFFRIMIFDITHNQNKQLVLRDFDISGKLIISKN